MSQRIGRPKPRFIGNARDTRGRYEFETLSTPAGTGITTASGGFYETSIERRGDLIFTRIFVDLTGLNSAAAGDIIGVNGAANCHLGQITVADCGTIIGAYLQCLETPATGADDIDLYAADEATGTEDAAITGLTNDAKLLDGDTLAANDFLSFNTFPTAGQYLYLVDAEGVSATYTAGKLLITFIGQA